jgi:hypothetical protein
MKEHKHSYIAPVSRDIILIPRRYRPIVFAKTFWTKTRVFQQGHQVIYNCQCAALRYICKYAMDMDLWAIQRDANCVGAAIPARSGYAVPPGRQGTWYRGPSQRGPVVG